MQGLELSRCFWRECGKPLLEARFPELMELLAVGLVGSGSECYGFDDGLSRDHDFEPGFCVFLPGEERVDRRTAFLLERALTELPREFLGVRRTDNPPAGGSRHGVFRTAEWYERMTGTARKPVHWRDFAPLPESTLAEVTNGEVFYDGCGEFTAYREAWSHPPEDFTRKKLCGLLLTASQAGEYNYGRCLQRGDPAAAQLAANEFVGACIDAACRANGSPAPFYKWKFRALRRLPDGGVLAELLEAILLHDRAAERIPEAAGELLRILRLTDFLPPEIRDLQQAAFYLESRVADPELRTMSPMALV